MDAYESELEHIVNVLQVIPKKLSEANVKVLGTHNHFETFEDQLPGGAEAAKPQVKRLSLSGSIIVLDIDFSSPNLVENVNISLSSETQVAGEYSPMAPVNEPNLHLLKSLRQPRLDIFAEMLAFLSRCDRYSTKEVDCFSALDQISEAIHRYSQVKDPSAFGKLVVNPPKRLGLGMLYHGSDHYAYLDVSPGARREFCLRKFDKVEEWYEQGGEDWKIGITLPEYDSRAELALTLDPPVVISESLATSLHAVISDSRPALDARKHSSSYTLPRHSRFATEAIPSDDFEVTIGNMLPSRLVEVKQFPLPGPSAIPAILGYLRQGAVAGELVQSLMRGQEPVIPPEAGDLNIADALGLKDQPVSRRRVPLAIALRQTDEAIIINVSWTLSDLQMIVSVAADGSIQVETKPEIKVLNLPDVEKLVRKGNLALAVSYVLSSLGGRIHRYSTSTVQG